MNTTQPHRILTDHKVNGLNEAIAITSTDEPGPGGANHEYHIVVYPKADAWIGEKVEPVQTVILKFQNGPIGEAGFNGLSNEALLAVLIDRMRGFQYRQVLDEKGNIRFDPHLIGKFACRENAIALTHLKEALMWLQKRTRDRMARGVEGTNNK